jgi:hypothetical protein
MHCSKGASYSITWSALAGNIRGEMNMYPKTNRPLRHFLPAIAIFGAVIGWSSPSDAYVQKIVIGAS